MTDLRRRMLEELQRRNFSETTIKTYLRVVEDFAGYFGKRPDRLDQHDIRKYQVHLLQERKLTVKTVRLHTAALRFFYVKTLRRRYLPRGFTVSQEPEKTPVGFESGRSRAPDRLRKQPARLRDADDVVCDRCAAGGAMPIESGRH
jgi:hypothetical protein